MLPLLYDVDDPEIDLTCCRLGPEKVHVVVSLQLETPFEILDLWHEDLFHVDRIRKPILLAIEKIRRHCHILHVVQWRRRLKTDTNRNQESDPLRYIASWFV